MSNDSFVKKIISTVFYWYVFPLSLQLLLYILRNSFTTVIDVIVDNSGVFTLTVYYRGLGSILPFTGVIIVCQLW